MANVGIFFGSDTGNTENVAKMIQKQLSTDVADIFDIINSSKKDIEKYNRLFLGISTWYYGEPQCDWDNFFPILENIDFKGKIVALFGCGDQENYAEYFCDAMGTLKNIIKPNGARLVGSWPTIGYNFEESKGLIDKYNFIGLPIDENIQPELTENRVKNWVEKVCIEMNLG